MFLLAQVGQEEAPIDAAVKDGHAHLAAFAQYFPAIETRFASQFGGSEVVGQG